MGKNKWHPLWRLDIVRDIEKIQYLYFEKELSLSEIANIYNCNLSTIKKHLLNHGYKLRTRTEGIRLIIKKGKRRHYVAGLKGPLNPSWKGGRRKSGPYIRIIDPKSKCKCGTTLEHRLIWEQFHKKELSKDWIVHHLNGIPTDNRPENLLAVPRDEHNKLNPALQNRIRELESEINWLKNKIQEALDGHLYSKKQRRTYNLKHFQQKLL